MYLVSLDIQLIPIFNLKIYVLFLLFSLPFVLLRNSKFPLASSCSADDGPLSNSDG